MGCSESKIDNVTTMNQCKERKSYMKQSVMAHNAFVSAHYAYATALKNTGVALCDYARSEFRSLDDHSPPPHHQSLPPHPPGNNGILAWDFFVMLMEHGGGGGVVKSGYGGSKAVEEGGEGRLRSFVVEDVKNVNLLKVFRELADGFIKASESVYEVLNILEVNKLHYHNSRFANNQGQIKHTTRRMNIINGAKVDFSSKEMETHATILDKMLAWEKRLYDQVKAGEKMKYEYQKKLASLNKHRKRSVSSDTLKHAEAAVNHLHAKYTMKTQSIDSTVSEIVRLRDEHLYPKLVQIVKQMGEMWKNMQKQHQQQSTIVQKLNNIKISQSTKNTSEHNFKNIEKLHLQVTIWCSEFENLMKHQKEYIKSLNNWLKLNLICTDHTVKPQNPKIESLLRTWNDEIEKLPEEGAKTAIRSFGSVTAAIVEDQLEEMKMKERCDEIRREITRKTRDFEEWCDKQIAKRIPSEEKDVDVMDDMDMIAEQQVAVEVLKPRLTEAEEVHRRHRVQVKDTAVVNLAAALPEVFTAMVKFSGACSYMYGRLKSVF